jgi:Chitobiase/beta-hexosaminidase C-terminal domain
MPRGLGIGFGAQPFTLQCAPIAFNLMPFDAQLVTNAGLVGYGMTALPIHFALTVGAATTTVGGTFPAATPTFSPAGGSYGNAQRVTMACASAGTATIYYTMDGTTPTTASTLYAGAINVPSSATLKAIAIVPGFGQSAAGTALYTITLGVPAGATALGYTVSQYNVAPQVSDIAMNAAQWAAGTYKFSNRAFSDPGAGSAASGYSTAQGVLALINSGSTAYGSVGGITGQMPSSTAGSLPYLNCAQGFYSETHVAISGSDPDHDDTIFFLPQEHYNGNLPYLEIDMQEGFYQAGLFSTVVSWLKAEGAKQNYSSFGTPAFDQTQFHRYGWSYDPVGMKVTFYLDDVQTFQVSTNQTDANGQLLDNGIKAFHYYAIIYPQAHSTTAPVPYTQYVSNVQAWIAPIAGLLAAPAGVQVLQQGQTSAGASTFDPTNTWFIPSNPNSMTIQWNTVSGATQYKVYRSINGGTATLLPAGTVTAGGGATQTFTDATASACVGLHPAPPPQFATATSYAYYVSTVNAFGEGSKSTQFSWILYGTQAGALPIAGTAIYQDLTYAGSANYGGSIGASGPCMVFTPVGSFGAWLAVLGNTGCNWNIWSGGFNFLSFDIWVTASNTFNLSPHVRTPQGDTLDSLFNSSGGNVSYNFPVTLLNQWVTIKIALTALRTDFRNSTAPSGAYTAGSSVLQSSIYKMDFQPQTSATFGVRNYVLTVT